MLIAECAQEDPSRPFGSLISADRAFADAVQIRADVRGWLPEAPERHRAFAAIAEHLRVMARERPVVLVLEDVQWSDQETLHLRPYLSRRAAGAALLVVATFRSEDAGSASLSRAIASFETATRSRSRSPAGTRLA